MGKATARGQRTATGAAGSQANEEAAGTQAAGGIGEQVRINVENPDDTDQAARYKDQQSAWWKFGKNGQAVGEDDADTFSSTEAKIELAPDAFRLLFRLFGKLLVFGRVLMRRPQTELEGQIIMQVWPFTEQECMELSEAWTDAVNKSNLPIKKIKEGTVWGTAIGTTAEIIGRKASTEQAIIQAQNNQPVDTSGLQRFPIPDPSIPPYEGAM